MPFSPPEVTFFVESREEAEVAGRENRKIRSRGQFLLDRLGEGDVVQALQGVRGRLSVAISRRDVLDDGALIDFLNEMNALEIALDVWPTLSDEDGYWVHAGNIQKARAEVFAIIEELERKQIDFKNVGLDLEFPIGLMQGGSTVETLRRLMKMRPWRFSQMGAAEDIRKLMEEILQSSNYGVHTYEVPILSDNEQLRRILGIPKAPTVAYPTEPMDRNHAHHENRHKRVGLVYTSATPPLVARNPAKFVKEYSDGRGRIPALGIVSASEANPGRDLVGKVGFLSDEELQRDVRAALEVSPRELFVFALNGKPVIDRTRAAIEAALKTGAGTRT